MLADDSDDVRDDTFEESFSDQCDIAKELKNQDEKRASIDSETSTKHDESNTKSKNLHEESICPYTVTESGNLQTKSTNRHNPLGSSASCEHDSAEISRLNLKLDRFSENVTNKLQNLSVEITNIKENKPYSILVLENIVNDLKEDKLVLIRKNDELREQNMEMSHIISDLKMANKNLESEKSSLLTALKLIQNDYQQTCTKTIVENDGENNVELICETIEGSEVTQPKPSPNQPANDKHPNTEASTGKNRKKRGKKSKSKPSAQNSSQQTADVDTSGGMNTSSSKSTGQGQKQLLLQGTQLLKILLVRK